MATVDPNQTPSPTDEYEDVDNTLEDVLYARHAEIKTFEDLEQQRGTSIPALFNQLYKFVQNPSSISVETFKRMVDTDDTIGSGVDFLTTALAARLGRYMHPSPEIAEFVNKTLDEINGGWTNLLKELLSATWAGFSVGEIVWANKEHGFVPEKIVTLPPSTVLFETERTGELTPDGIMQYQRNFNPFMAGNGLGYLMGGASFGQGFTGSDASRPDPFAKFGDLPFPMRTANSFNYLSIRIPRQKCIHYPFNAQGQMGNPYGRSLLRRAYKHYVTKDAILQMMMIALDRKGTPLTIIYADPNTMMEDASADQSGKSNLDASQFRNKQGKGIRADYAARDAFKNVHNDSVIVLPGKKGEIYDATVLEQNPNTQDFIAALGFANMSILRALLVPALIFGNGDGTGSYSLGQEHAKTFDKLCDSINAGLEHVLLQQLIKQIIAYNFPRSAWEKDGLGSLSKRTLSRDEIEKEIDVFEKGVNMGIIDQNDLNDLNKMRETIGFEERDTPIQQVSPFGAPGGDMPPLPPIPGHEGASKEEMNPNEATPPGLPPLPGAANGNATEEELPPGSAEPKEQQLPPGGDKEAKKKFMARLMAAVRLILGLSEKE